MDMSSSTIKFDLSGPGMRTGVLSAGDLLYGAQIWRSPTALFHFPTLYEARDHCCRQSSIDGSRLEEYRQF